MRAYLIYKDKSLKGFKRLMNAGGGAVFDKYRAFAVSFIKYAKSDLDKNLAMYDQELNIESITLENVFPKKYKWMVSDRALKTLRKYLDSLEDRVNDFQGKEDNLKVLIGLVFLRFVLITKIVETYLINLVNMKRSGQDVSNVNLEDIGIGRNILKYFNQFEEFDAKTIDDWLNVKIDPSTAAYFYSSMKRILNILLGE